MVQSVSCNVYLSVYLFVCMCHRLYSLGDVKVIQRLSRDGKNQMLNDRLWMLVFTDFIRLIGLLIYLLILTRLSALISIFVICLDMFLGLPH